MHVPDFAVVRPIGHRPRRCCSDGRETASPALGVRSGPRRSDSGTRHIPEADLHDGFRLDNARDLLRYATYRVSLGDRVRLLTLLEEQGPMPLAACMQVIRDGRDAIGTIAAMALRRFVGIDLDDARIGPETRVSRCHD